MTMTETIQNPATIVDIENLTSPTRILRPVNGAIVSELARSIQNSGLLQPIVVRRKEKGYEVIFGHHRLLACRRLGLKKILVVVKDFNDDEAFLARVAENLLRNSYIDPIEEAQGYKALLDKGWTINAIGRRVGKCDSYICERLAIVDRLDSRLLSRISQGRRHLTPSHAEVLARIRNSATQLEIAELVERKRLSVRALEDILKGGHAPKKVPIEDMSGQCCLRIPSEFAKDMELVSGQYVYIYKRGMKLILESAERRSKCRRKTMNHDLDHGHTVGGFARAKDEQSIGGKE